MVTLEAIQTFVDDVVRKFHPTKVILFGSYASGDPTEDSDVDLLLITPHKGSNTQLATKIRLACPRSFSMDLLVRTPAEVRRRLQLGDQFLREILTSGIVLHENHDARVSRSNQPPPLILFSAIAKLSASLTFSNSSENSAGTRHASTSASPTNH
jgi:predicted nucleotidyltransferase